MPASLPSKAPSLHRTIAAAHPRRAAAMRRRRTADVTAAAGTFSAVRQTADGAGPRRRCVTIIRITMLRHAACRRALSLCDSGVATASSFSCLMPDRAEALSMPACGAGAHGDANPPARGLP
jgi:hypothetical protein